VVALVSGSFDDSQTDGRLWALAGFVGYSNQWDFFEDKWRAVLKAHDVPYFHMREMGDPNGKFKKWYPAEEHQDEVTAFFKDMVKTIRDSHLRWFGSIVYLPDLERFNREKGLDLKPYPLAAYACLTEIGRSYNSIPVTAVFDRVEKVDSKLAAARAYAESDQFLFPGISKLVTSTPLAAGLTSRDVPAMQAADFAVWEGRKAHLSFEPWVNQPDRPLGDREAQWENLKEWSRLNHGQDYPIQRKSLEALIDDGLRFKFIVWDHQQICQAHDARRGIWAVPSEERLS
jgi:hypothetical protein